VRYDSFETPSLEHIAPQTENTAEDSGYPPYNEEFRNQYLHTLGNYLLTTRRHDSSLSNKPLREKLESYDYLEQHREIRKIMEEKGGVWDNEKINSRKEKLVKFVLDNF
jgi:hypothetical protein